MSTPNDAIELCDSDSDSGDFMPAHTVFDRVSTFANSPEPTTTITLDDDDEDEGLVPLAIGKRWHDVQSQKAASQATRGLPGGHRHVRHWDAFGTHRIKSGMNVPLVDKSFFRIKHLTQDVETGEVSMHGFLLKRPLQMNEQMKRDTGELALIVCTQKDDKRTDLERAVEQVPLTEIDFTAEKLNRDIIFTNQRYPALRDWTKRDFNYSQEEHWARGRLLCRIKSIEVFPTKGGKSTKLSREAWIWLSEQESDPGFAVPDISKTLTWRGNRDSASATSSSSCFESVVSSARQTKRVKTTNEDVIIEVEESEFHEVKTKRTTTRKQSRDTNSESIVLKAGDMCCGAGGVSGGMDEAGFEIAVGVDSWHPAAETFRMNWPAPATETYEKDISDFVIGGDAKACTYCHVVHFSLPCQYFSPAHTTSEITERDEKNIATNLVVEPALKALRPMYATFENTSGLGEIEKHREYFNILIKALTDLGWSAVFRIEKLSKYNNPQQRRRLIVIAAFPGMPLIDFPTPTHGTGPGLLPAMTVGEAISKIDHKDVLHNSKELRHRQLVKPSAMPIADRHTPLRELINTSGPRALHPNGKRRFTYREGMRLMRFRDRHKLSPAAKTQGDKWRLIGNAVPRDIIVHIYKDIHQVLQKWFAKANAPIVLDHKEDVMTASAASTATLRSNNTPEFDAKRKRKATALSRSGESRNVSVSQTSARSFSVPVRSRQTPQSRVTEAFRVQRKTKTQPAATTPSSSALVGWKNVVDLTED